jgi:hypothetical protein
MDWGEVEGEDGGHDGEINTQQGFHFHIGELINCRFVVMIDKM